MIKDITSANSSISCVDVLGNHNLEGYAADSALGAEIVKMTKTRKGVDGQMSAGFVPSIKRFQIDFEASSSSISHFLDLAQLAESTRTPQPVVMTITIPAVGKRFVCNGVLTDYPPVFNIKSTLEAMSFSFDFQDIIPMPI